MSRPLRVAPVEPRASEAPAPERARADPGLCGDVSGAVALAAHTLGPAEVLAVRAGGYVALRLEDGSEVEARLALAVAYQPEPGDEVLAVGDAARAWVIGVIAGRGRAQLEFPGDVEIRSTSGSVRLSAERSVELAGRDVSLRARALRLVAESATHTFTSFVQTVSELLSVRAKRQHTLVEESADTQAGRATLVTREECTINGKTVHLG